MGLADDELHLGDDGLPPRGLPVGFCLFETVLGSCGIAWGPRGITAVQLPQQDPDAVRAALQDAQPGASEAAPPEPVQQVITRIQDVVAGRSRDDLADVPLDYSGLSDFLRRTYAITRTIAPGSTL